MGAKCLERGGVWGWTALLGRDIFENTLQLAGWLAVVSWKLLNDHKSSTLSSDFGDLSMSTPYTPRGLAVDLRAQWG